MRQWQYNRIEDSRMKLNEKELRLRTTKRTSIAVDNNTNLTAFQAIGNRHLTIFVICI